MLFSSSHFRVRPFSKGLAVFSAELWYLSAKPNCAFWTICLFCHFRVRPVPKWRAVLSDQVRHDSAIYNFLFWMIFSSGHFIVLPDCKWLDVLSDQVRHDSAIYKGHFSFFRPRRKIDFIKDILWIKLYPIIVGCRYCSLSIDKTNKGKKKE